MNKYTSFLLSKKLWENGCKIHTDCIYNGLLISMNHIEEMSKILGKKFQYPTYDILWDICIKYAKEFFGDDTQTGYWKQARDCVRIFALIRSNTPQEEIESYIWDNCLFNPKNKKFNFRDWNKQLYIFKSKNLYKLSNDSCIKFYCDQEYIDSIFKYLDKSLTYQKDYLKINDIQIILSNEKFGFYIEEIEKEK